MKQYDEANPYQATTAGYSPLAAAADEWERSIFIRRTYSHLAGAIGVFIALECLFFTLVSQAAQQNLMRTMAQSPMNWLVVLGLFIGVSWLANHWAHNSTRLSTQYMGLGLFVIAEAIIFTPLLFFGMQVPGAIPTAAILTGIIFGGLTVFVLVTKSDFSGLGKYLWVAGLAAFGYIALALIVPGMAFGLGGIFSTLMVALAAGYILYDTSNVLHHYRTNQHVAASLALFASVAFLFWYVLRIVIMLSGRD